MLYVNYISINLGVGRSNDKKIFKSWGENGHPNPSNPKITIEDQPMKFILIIIKLSKIKDIESIFIVTRVMYLRYKRFSHKTVNFSAETLGGQME